MSVRDDKAAARKTAFERRAGADRAVAVQANAHLTAAIRDVPGRVVSGYWPIRTEIDPRATLNAVVKTHDVCLPVVAGTGLPLSFRRWTPGCAMERGVYGASIPTDPAEVTPDILIVPFAAFDVAGYRLGYGGGFYDRTLERLRGLGPVTAIGFAYAVQQVEQVPREATDQPLDMIVTENGVIKPETI